VIPSMTTSSNNLVYDPGFPTFVDLNNTFPILITRLECKSDACAYAFSHRSPGGGCADKCRPYSELCFSMPVAKPRGFSTGNML
jgi:hypothetical protein